MVSSNFFHYHTLIYCSKNRLKVNFDTVASFVIKGNYKTFNSIKCNLQCSNYNDLKSEDFAN